MARIFELTDLGVGTYGLGGTPLDPTKILPIKDDLNAEKDVLDGVSANNTATLNISTISEIASVDRIGRTRLFVNDLDRGGLFDYESSGYTANGGTVFDALGGGYWVRQFSGDPYLKWWGPAGDGSTNDGAIIQTAVSFSNIILSDDTEYSIGSTALTIPSNRRITGGVNSKITSTTGYIEIYGERGIGNSNLTTSFYKGQDEIEVVDASSFTVGDYIEITQSLGYFNNSTNKPASELNKVVSISTNTITLETPLSHDYPATFTEPSTVYKVDSVKENIELKNITFGVSVRFSYVNNLKIFADLIENRAFGNGVNFGASKNVDIISYSENNIALAYPTSCFYFYNIRNLTFNVKIKDAPLDAIRTWGCSRVDGKYMINNAKQRALNIYNSQDCHFIDCVVEGDVVQTGNYETTLVNYCENIIFDNLYVNEPNKSGDVSIFEFRGRSKNVKLINSTLYNYIFTPITLKCTAVGALIDNNVIYNKYDLTGAASIVDFQSGPISGDESVRITRNRVVAEGTQGCVLLRSTSDAHIDDFDYPSIVVEDNIIDRGSGAIVLLDGLSTGNKITYLSVKNNTCLKNNAISGSLITIIRPIFECQLIENYMDVAGSRRLICSSAERVLIANNRCSSYSISGYTIAMINGMGYESIAGSTPTYSEWKTGDIIDFTSTGTSTASGVYIKKYDLTYSRLNRVSEISADTSAAIGATFSQSEVQAILTELRDLKTKLRNSGLLKT